MWHLYSYCVLCSIFLHSLPCDCFSWLSIFYLYPPKFGSLCLNSNWDNQPDCSILVSTIFCFCWQLVSFILFLHCDYVITLCSDHAFHMMIYPLTVSTRLAAQLPDVEQPLNISTQSHQLNLLGSSVFFAPNAVELLTHAPYAKMNPLSRIP
jgi:hypothetical protein